MRTAARNGNEDFVKLLVQRGFDLSKPTGSGEDTPLFAAVESGSLPLVEYIISNGADVSELDHRNSSAIHKAAWHGHLGVVKILLEHGANPFRGDDGPNEVCYGETALEEAISEKHQDIVDFLLPRMSSEVPTETILGIARGAISAGNLETARLLLDKVPDDLSHLTHNSMKCDDSILGAAVK
jgi:ankyrin repeat protein